MQPGAHRNHYVAQFYLRGWAAPDGRVFRYKRVRGKVAERPVSPKATAFRHDLYTVRSTLVGVPEADGDALEKKFLSPLDDAAAKVLPKLLGTALTVTGEERMVWAMFLNSLLERDPRTLEKNDRVARELAAAVMTDARARITEENRGRMERAIARFDAEAAARNTVRSVMVHEIKRPDVLQYFVGQEWLVIPALGDLEFISDRPLLANGGVEERPIQWLTMAFRQRISSSVVRERGGHLMTFCGSSHSRTTSRSSRATPTSSTPAARSSMGSRRPGKS